jgi:hypothetical protein
MNVGTIGSSSSSFLSGDTGKARLAFGFAGVSVHSRRPLPQSMKLIAPALMGWRSHPVVVLYPIVVVVTFPECF